MDERGSRVIRQIVDGLAIIMYSPSSAAHIPEGADYFTANYQTEADVQRHIQAGSIVGFGTGSPGDYELRILAGAPSNERLAGAEMVYRLGLRCDGQVVFRDLYTLMNWPADIHPDEVVQIPAGTYRITLCSDVPPSGTYGDDQVIEIYFEEWPHLPDLATEGIPHLIRYDQA